MKNVYVWYSKLSEDSGRAIAGLLGTTNHGTLPPKDFSGTLVCYGASPGDKFKWEGRTIRSIMNDPRKTRKYIDRMEMLKKVKSSGATVLPIVKLTPLSELDVVCDSLGINSTSSFAVFQANGGNASLVKGPLQFKAALVSGAVYASTSAFLSEKRTRLFIVEGTFVAAVAKMTSSPEMFAKNVAKNQSFVKDKSEAEALIRNLVDTGQVSPLKTFWQPFSAVPPEMVKAAVAAAKGLDMGFCAVDITFSVSNTPIVLNVVSTPDIVSYPEIHPALADGFKLWLKRAAKSAKEIIADLAKEASEEEAELIVNELKKLKTDTAAG